MATIGFIGLGNMGAPMLANLVKAGHRVSAFDLSEQAQKAGANAGGQIVKSAGDVAAGADVIITMLPAGKHVLSVYNDPQGPLAKAKAGTLFVDCSTIDVASSRTAHATAQKAGMLSLDAPVSGGVGGATAGTLTFMVGGSDKAFGVGQPVLAHMGKKIVHCGGDGAGQAAKICNNMVLGISMIAVGEAFVLGEKLGLSHQALFDVVSTASGQCWSMNSYCPVPGPVPTSPANNDYKPGFAAELMLKDLSLAMEAARTAHADCALGAHAKDIYDTFKAEGHANKDFSAIINAIRARSGE
ncbi:MAG TPA: 3-hydroxyisobutyrate dehydrogenase [Beijerinckiaceae bacterium]|jgi:3-hydroxyisobutyrate dehydrogenase|nr:3-hydroxyisobutyrate dehydrogenase [Beijerinckiaceae bacterium]